MAHLPLPFTEQLQTGPFDGQMQRPLLRPSHQFRHRQISRPSRQVEDCGTGIVSRSMVLRLSKKCRSSLKILANLIKA